MNYLALLALLAGMLITIQTSLNTQLGQILGSPILATSIAFFSSLMFTLVLLPWFVQQGPSADTVKSVPYYLWFLGGLCSASGVFLFYWLIPQMGAGAMVSCAMAGQICIALLAGHFGWFQLPTAPLTSQQVLGGVLLILGVFLINGTKPQ